MIFIFACFVYGNIKSYQKETAFFERLDDTLEIEFTDHASVVSTRDRMIDLFINTFKSDEQLDLWHSNRDALRQSAFDTVMGKMALCGEFTRVMVKILRVNDIPARRLYLFGGPGTSHVLFEYYNKEDGKWYMMNSFAAPEYVNMIFNEKKVEKQFMLSETDPNEFRYTEVTTLNQQLRAAFGDNLVLPVWASVLIDEPHLIRATGNTIVLLALILVFFGGGIVGRRSARSRMPAGVAAE